MIDHKELFGELVRARIENQCEALAYRWLEALREHLTEPAGRIFPTKTLLDHVPLLLRRLATAATGEQPTGRPEVRQELFSIASLRRSQGYSVDELTREFQILTDIVMSMVEEFVDVLDQPPHPRAVVQVVRALQNSLSEMATLTVQSFRRDYTSDRLDRAHLLDDFGRAVTHELRNRLNTVLLTVELMRADCAAASPEKLMAGLDRLLERLNHLEPVVADVYTVAVSGGRADPVEQAFRPLDAVIRDAIANADEYAASRSVLVRTVGPVPRFTVDATRVQLVLTNLISNGIKYSNQGADKPLVEISVSRVDGPLWGIDVGDNGVGIQSKDLARIFERYQRGTTPLDVDGQGIGLSLANEAVAQLGGRISVESTPGQGSRFRFTLREPFTSFTSDSSARAPTAEFLPAPDTGGESG